MSHLRWAMVRSTLARAFCAVVLAACALVPSAAMAQGEREVGRRLVADAIWRASVLDLRLRHEPLDRDYRLVGLLLDRAQGYAPSDTELARERVEAWFQAGELDRVIDACRQILVHDPSDTVAQLRLITSQISRQQTVGERLAIYARFLGPGGAGLDPSVRSRLALDAALLHRERGDLDGFIDHLSMATGLDPTNKEAAALAEAFYASKMSDAPGRLEMLCNLLYADPLDVQVHRSIALLLGRVGAYSQSRRFYVNAVAIMYASGMSPETSVGVDQLVLRWQEEGPASVVKELNTAILSQRDTARRTIQELDRQGIPSTGVTPPAELRLPIALEQVRLLAADAAGDLETRAASAIDLSASVDKLVATVSAQGSAGLIGVDYAMEAAATAISEYLVVTAISNEQSEQIRTAMRAFLSREDVDIEYREQLTPWVELRSGSASTARDKFLALGAENPTMRMGAAMCEEELGNHAEARRLLEEIAAVSRSTVLGAWARAKAMGKDGVWGDARTDEAFECREIAASVPKWVDEMITQPRSYMSLTADASSVGGRNTLRVTIRNLSPLPLAVGPERPINSRLLISPKVDVGIQKTSLDALPEVVLAERRIRLLQGEAVEIEIWPDIGYAGWLIETQSLRTVRVRWGVIQGFQSGVSQTYVPGPLCLMTQSEQVVRGPVMSDAAHEALVGWFGSVGGQDGRDVSDVHRATMRLRGAVFMSESEGGSSESELRAYAEALGSRYASLSAESRIVLIAGAPHSMQHAAMEPLDRAIERERDPEVLGMAMLARARDSSSPLLATARESGVADLVRIATLLGERFDDGDVTFGSVGPGIRALAGPGLVAGRGVAPGSQSR
ncbi:MAG: hypothetical protein KIT19_12690 [Phycisphaeraceae bacterium]|nr:hypothetical protein [Phycisphaeraceae bacterium]